MEITKEELQKHLEIVIKLRDNIRYAKERYINANKKEKKKLEIQYDTERMTAQNYIRMDLRDYIFEDKRSDMDIEDWLRELPTWQDMDKIKKNIEKRLEE